MAWPRPAAVVFLLSGLMFASDARADFGGAYIGTHFGGIFPDIGITGDFDNPDPASYTLEPDDWTAGVHAGYSHPIALAIIGLEFAVSAAQEADTRDVDTQGTPRSSDFASFSYGKTVALAARVGLPVSGRVMPS